MLDVYYDSRKMTGIDYENTADSMLTSSRYEHQLFFAALSSLLILVAGTLLYPDTFANMGFHLGLFRISPMAILFLVTSPAVLLYVWIKRKSLSLNALDISLLVTIIYVICRGLSGDNPANLQGLIVAYAGYVLVLYFGTALVGQKFIAVRTIYLLTDHPTRSGSVRTG